MLRTLALLCLVLSVLGVAPKKPVDNKPAVQPKPSGGLQPFNVGKRVAGDKLIWAGKGNQAVDFAKEITVEVPFPEYGVKNDAVISQIIASTVLDAGTSQFSIQSGGVGQKSVNLKIVTDGAHKITYNIAIYGK